jgi:hypothetical protein
MYCLAKGRCSVQLLDAPLPALCQTNAIATGLLETNPLALLIHEGTNMQETSILRLPQALRPTVHPLKFPVAYVTTRCANTQAL